MLSKAIKWFAKGIQGLDFVAQVLMAIAIIGGIIWGFLELVTGLSSAYHPVVGISAGVFYGYCIVWVLERLKGEFK